MTDRAPGGSPADYFSAAIERGEPAGVWLGSGMAGLGLPMRAGQEAREEDLRAIFGQLRYPTSVMPHSTAQSPVYLGTKPRAFKTLAERVAAAQKQEPDAERERLREIEIEAAKASRSNTAYYDVTFSPAKSISIYYTALLAVGDLEGARSVREAHDQAVRIAVESAEVDLAWTRIGRHGRAGPSGRTVGEWARATGLSAVHFAHHTNRDGEPQLHVHVAVLNRVALPDGRVYALDGRAFGPVKDAMRVAYERALEQQLGESLEVVFGLRVDGVAREILGIDPELIEEASTRTRAAVEPRIAELVDAYRARHGHDPGPRARRAVADQAVKETRAPKSGPAGPAAVADWVEKVRGRRERLEAALDAVDLAVVHAAMSGAGPHPATGGRQSGPTASVSAAHSPDMTSGPAGEGGPQRGPRSAGVAPTTADDLATSAGPMSAGPMSAGSMSAGPMSAGPMSAADVAREALGADALSRGLVDVQERYATWTVGNLVAALDRHLGDDAAALGLPIRERQAWVRRLAESALAPTSGHGVVQVSAGDPVPIPNALRRAVDGRSRFRAHIDERYATADHLSLERRLVAAARTSGAPALAAPVVARVADVAAARGHSPDQVDAVQRILASPRQVEILVGPAGAGKSHTLGHLAEVWAAEHRTQDGDGGWRAGRVIGTATAEAAARNLAGLGMEVHNTTNLVKRLTPDPDGHVADRLGPADLVVFDEAGMASSKELDTITGLAAAAGAKIVWAGDHRQLSAVEAGGMFSHLVGLGDSIELTEVHRFTAAWERQASLQLRAGDPDAAAAYADHGRLRHGTLEQLHYRAARDYVADRIEGKSALLIVGSNKQAVELSRDIHAHLVELGLVSAETLVRLPNRTDISAGDVIQARRNDRRIRVDAPPGAGVDDHGRPRKGLPVTNRELYTVIGRDQSSGVLLARDERGGVAHLPPAYVREHVGLAYATTNHAAQGLSVDRGRAIGDRGMTLEALYPAMTRGRELNVLYLVTDVEPDPHDPQRVRDTLEARVVSILERGGGDEAALSVLAAGAEDNRSLRTVAELYDLVATERGHGRHGDLVADRIGPSIHADPALGAVLGRLRAAEIAGHEAAALLDEALAMPRSIHDARSVAQVLHWRLGRVMENRVPERDPGEAIDPATLVRPAWPALAQQHHDRAAALVAGTEVSPDSSGERSGTRRAGPGGAEVEIALATLAERAHERTTELGARIAALAGTGHAPAWVTEWLGPVPDAATEGGPAAPSGRAGPDAAERESPPDPSAEPRPADAEARQAWSAQAGLIAAYREYRGIPEGQMSIGPAPPAEAQPLAYELWLRAAQVGAGDPHAIDWRRASDSELRHAVERWEREQAFAPAEVSSDRSEALALAHDAHADAVVGRAQLAALPPGTPERERLEIRVGSDEAIAQNATAYAAELDDGHRARQSWWHDTAHIRESARAAQVELTRRRPGPDGPGPDTSRPDGSGGPDPRGPSDPGRPTGPDATPGPGAAPHGHPGADLTPSPGSPDTVLAERLERAVRAGELERIQRDATATVGIRLDTGSETGVDVAAGLDPSAVDGPSSVVRRERDLQIDRELAQHGGARPSSAPGADPRLGPVADGPDDDRRSRRTRDYVEPSDGIGPG